MAKTECSTATTLDGFSADENNSLDWLVEVDCSDELELVDVSRDRQFARLEYRVTGS